MIVYIVYYPDAIGGDIQGVFQNEHEAYAYKDKRCLSGALVGTWRVV